MFSDGAASGEIAENELLIRDGIHLKVKDTLPLQKYLLWYVHWDNIGLDSDISTPKEFTEKSNRMFRQLFEGKI